LCERNRSRQSKQHDSKWGGESTSHGTCPHIFLPKLGIGVFFAESWETA
jgi:hypothetical protein